MNILAIETATEVCGAAIIQSGFVRAEEFIEAPQVHSQKILTLVDNVLRSMHLSLKDIDGIAVSIGPGSFTGLRIGLSTAKGLAFALDKPIVAVPTLMALASNVLHNMNASGNALILPMIDARRDEVYVASYRIRGKELHKELHEEMAPAAVKLDDLHTLLEAEKFVIPAGNAAAKFFRSLEARGAQESGRFVTLPDDVSRCSAAAVGILGARLLESGQKTDVASLEPFYVKEFYTTMTPLPIEHR